MLNPTLDRRPLSLRAVVLTSALLLIVTLPTAAFRARQAPLPLAGSVYDATGAVLPGVELTVEDARKNKFQAVTDASGHFEFSQLEPGHYVLEASLAGFRALRHEFDLKNARDWDRAITLQVGELTETVAVKGQRLSGAQAPSMSAGPQRIRVGGNIRVPRRVKDVDPVYPPSMREAGREGVVPLEAIIGRDGTVHSVRVLSANIHPDFAVAAADAVRQWRFQPTLLNGAPVEVTMTVTVKFSLSE
jgi:TonB family protein